MKNSLINSKKGISLIVLVITIVVIIILAATVIIQLQDNDPIDNATKAAFMQDVTSIQDELTMYMASQRANTLGAFKPSSLNATATTLTPTQKDNSGNEISGGNIYTVLPSLSKSKSLDGKIVITAGKLANKSLSGDELTWFNEIVK